MWKSVLAGAAAIAIAGTSIVYAQQRDHGPGERSRHHGEHRLSQEDRAAFTEARIAALKAGLQLTPEQEKNWPAFESALRDVAKSKMQSRDERRASRRERRQDEDPVVQLRRHAEMMGNTAAQLKQLADAQEPLYQSLTDSQKNRFQVLSKVLTSHRPHMAQMREMRRHHRYEMHRDRHHDRDDRRGRGRGGDDRDDDNRGGRGIDSESRGMGERL